MVREYSATSNAVISCLTLSVHPLMPCIKYPSRFKFKKLTFFLTFLQHSSMFKSNIEKYHLSLNPRRSFCEEGKEVNPSLHPHSLEVKHLCVFSSHSREAEAENANCIIQKTRVWWALALFLEINQLPHYMQGQNNSFRLLLGCKSIFIAHVHVVHEILAHFFTRPSSIRGSLWQNSFMCNLTHKVNFSSAWH